MKNSCLDTDWTLGVASLGSASLRLRGRSRFGAAKARPSLPEKMSEKMLVVSSDPTSHETFIISNYWSDSRFSRKLYLRKIPSQTSPCRLEALARASTNCRPIEFGFGGQMESRDDS